MCALLVLQYSFVYLSMVADVLILVLVVIFIRPPPHTVRMLPKTRRNKSEKRCAASNMDSSALCAPLLPTAYKVLELILLQACQRAWQCL